MLECSDFNPKYYDHIDLDKLFLGEEVVVNNNLHVKTMYGFGGD